MNRIIIFIFSGLLCFTGPMLQAQKAFKIPSFANTSIALGQGLWMSKYETSIAEYDRFVNDLKQQGLVDQASRWAADDSVWTRDLSFNDPYAKYYNHHEAFKGYPVVGVSYEGVMAYCEWLTQNFGTLQLKDHTGKKRTVKLRYRLPTTEEWERAAGDDATPDTCTSMVFPGKIHFPRDHRGHWRFNYKLWRGNYAGWAGDHATDYEGYMITAPVYAFHPDNYLGFHNLAGNVAEMVMEEGIAKGGGWNSYMEECLTCAKMTYDSPKPWIGFRIVAEEVK